METGILSYFVVLFEAQPGTAIQVSSRCTFYPELDVGMFTPIGARWPGSVLLLLGNCLYKVHSFVNLHSHRQLNPVRALPFLSFYQG